MTEKSEKVPGGPTTPPETIPMAECSHARSHDHLSLRTESTVFSLARTEFPGTTALPRRAWRSHRPAIILISTGGSMLLAGFVLSGLYFAEEYDKLSAKEKFYSIGQMINGTSTNQTINNNTFNKTTYNLDATAPAYSTNETISSNTTNHMDSRRTRQTIYSLICGTIVGPPLVSIGLMVMMVGVVLIPVTREIRQQNSMKRLFSYKAQNVNA